MKVLAIVVLLGISITTQASNSKAYKVRGKTYHVLTSSKGFKETGTASWYGKESGKITASGAVFKPLGVSAAHKTLPLGSKIRVTNLDNGMSLVLKVADRGPFAKGRIVDLSYGAAKKLKVKGLAKVKIEGV